MQLQKWINKHNLPNILSSLEYDYEQDKYRPNQSSREVKSGHYVLVHPTPIMNPLLLHYSHNLIQKLHIPSSFFNESPILDFLSGNTKSFTKKTWATPYALSIYGQEMISNCPFGTGNGYGDGRAISIGVFYVNRKQYEFQLKGAGKTPFCRSGDGKAVMRSSIREYLASEAMASMGVQTTRALSLIISKTEKVLRSSFKKNGENKQNTVAIVCRVSGSFFRVGHLELFSRRTRKKNNRFELKQLKQLFLHIAERDYPDVYESNMPMDSLILEFLKACSISFSKLVAKWMSVGYVQSNMNSDNCSISGKTIDYGPFGFLDVYDRYKNFWVDSGEHFSYINQPKAMAKNFETLCHSLLPLLTEKSHAKLSIMNLIQEFPTICQDHVNIMWRKKLGFQSLDWSTEICPLFHKLEQLLQKSNVDWTMFWRELSWYPAEEEKRSLEKRHSVKSAFYDKSKYDEFQGEWTQWLEKWMNLLKKENRNPLLVTKQMWRESPKYVPKEWMLSKAVDDAKNGNYKTIGELYQLFSTPFTNQPKMNAKWYKLTPSTQLNKDGIKSMTCSS